MYETYTYRNCGNEKELHMLCKNTDQSFKLIDLERLSEIIRMRKPIGLFLLETEGKFIGIDNSTGNVWIEEFEEEAGCLEWLAGLFEVD